MYVYIHICIFMYICVCEFMYAYVDMYSYFYNFTKKLNVIFSQVKRTHAVYDDMFKRDIEGAIYRPA